MPWQRWILSLQASLMRPYRNWLATFLWMGVIFFLSSRPADELPSFGLYDLLVKKSGHLTGYAILGWLFLRSWESLKDVLIDTITVFVAKRRAET